MLIGIVNTGISYSQTIDSLTPGKKYKIILFSEKEIIGTMISHDQNSISIRSDNIVMTIERNNIFSISKDLSASKYKFLINLFGAYIPKSENGYYFGQGSRSGIDIRASYFYSDKKNVGIEAAYFPSRKSSVEYTGTAVYTGGEIRSFEVIINGQFGTFDKNNIADFYLNLGVGVHTIYKNSVIENLL